MRAVLWHDEDLTRAWPCPPQVSRRLQRRLHRELGAGRYGYVKLAVEAYCHLLAQGKPEKSNLLAYELVVGTVVKRRRWVSRGCGCVA